MARRRSSVFIGDARAFKNIQGLDKLQKKIAALPDGIAKDIMPAREKGADELVAKAKSIAPVSEALEDTPGLLRDSIHREPGRNDLSVAVTVDAKDAEGRWFAKHVEYGHRTPEGVHVQAVPFFWPSYRVTKKKIRARVARSVTKAVKKAGGR